MFLAEQRLNLTKGRKLSIFTLLMGQRQRLKHQRLLEQLIISMRMERKPKNRILQQLHLPGVQLRIM